MSRQDFENYKKMLNPAQKEAVEHIEGPVMVVAGPGTGKTQILAVRIAEILQKTDTGPAQILCLTYTDAGVVAMRERLIQIMGPDAYRVNIHTFHSLCNEIIQYNGSYFGYRNLQPATDFDTHVILRKMVDELPADHPIKRLKGEVYYDVPELKGLFDIMKKEHYEPEPLKERIEKNFTEREEEGEFIYKRAGKGFAKGDRKEAAYQAEREKIEKLKSAIDLFPVYNQKMADARLYDFSDMILWVLKAFKEDSYFLMTYQERFLYFLVDEFQDTNGAQMELINLLSDFWEVPNLFAVGDSNQSIYRFQGAEIANMISFREKYKRELHTTILTDNYRSSQKILDASRELIRLNSEILPENENGLTAQNADYAQIEEGPQIQVYTNPVHETIGIGNQILSLHKEGVPYHEMAVLYNRHSQADDLIKFFTANEIPFSTKKKVNVLQERLVLKILKILRYIQAEVSKPYSGEEHIFEILNYDFYDIEPIDLAKMSTQIRQKRSKWRDFLADFRKAGKQDLFSNLPGYSSEAEIRRISSDLEYWIKESVNLTLAQLIEKIIAKGGILSYVMKADNKRWQIQILRTWFDFVREESAKNPTITLKQFLAVIENYNFFNIPVEAMQVLHVPDAVNLMTLHGSKGLEFEHVFIMGAVKEKWDKKGGRGGDFGLTKNLNTKDSQAVEIEEARRLMYVGMTRAKRALNISYYDKNLNEKAQNKVQYVSELEELAGLKSTMVQIQDKDIMEFESQWYSFEETPEFELLDHDYLEVLLEDYTLSATHLNAYLHCPVSFYFNHVIKVPAAKSESASFGTAIHAALENYFRISAEKRTAGEKLPGADELCEYFVSALWQNRDSFTEDSFERYMQHGKQILPGYFKHENESWEKETIYTLEKNMNGIHIEGVPVKGKIDKIIFDGKMAYVIDFKTGKYENARKKCGPPEGGEPGTDSFEKVYGGDYWRQMVFYRLLIDHDRKQDWKMSSGEMNFVEPDAKGLYRKERFNITNEDIDIVKSQIKETYGAIKSHQFEKGCGEENCEWCNFVKYYLKKRTYVAENLPSSGVDEED